MLNSYYLYILTNSRNTVLYIGITNDLKRRVFEHKTKIIKGFTSKYGLDKLIYFEEGNDINEVILKEKQMKKWKREFKFNLIKKENPDFKDLANDWY